MRPKTTPEFIRGVLFSYAAYYAWLYFGAWRLGLGLYQFEPIQFWMGLLFFLFYVVFALGLLFRPLAFAKPVFIAFGAISFLPVLGAFFASRQRANMEHAQLGIEFFWQLTLGLGVAGLAFWYYRLTENQQVRPEVEVSEKS